MQKAACCGLFRFWWMTGVGSEPSHRLFDVRIVAVSREPFHCGNATPVPPDVSVDEAPKADVVIVPEVWLGPQESSRGRHDALIEWLQHRYPAGTKLYSACSGALQLAETSWLDGCDRNRASRPAGRDSRAAPEAAHVLAVEPHVNRLCGR